MNKPQIRARMRALLPLPPDVRGERSRRICECIVAHPAWSTARTVATFAPQQREPDVDLLWQHGAARSFAYPRVEGDFIVFHRVGSIFELQPAQWGIREPATSAQSQIRPDEIDLILVPGVAFTREGQRCGRGGGYYDRLLADLPARTAKLGVCFAEQIVDSLPLEAHDAMVDGVIFA